MRDFIQYRMVTRIPASFDLMQMQHVDIEYSV